MTKKNKYFFGGLLVSVLAGGACAFLIPHFWLSAVCALVLGLGAGMTSKHLYDLSVKNTGVE